MQESYALSQGETRRNRRIHSAVYVEYFLILRIMCGECLVILRSAAYTASMYIYEHKDWTRFTWDESVILPLLSDVRFAQGRLLGELNNLGFDLESEAELNALADEVIASSRVEGVSLDAQEVRSSLSRQLGLDAPDQSLDTSRADGAVEIMLDATRRFDEPLSHERLHAWQAALFPTGRSGLRPIRVGGYREGKMEVVSGPFGKEKIHYVAPQSTLVQPCMDSFISWVNESNGAEPLIKAGLAHLWFLTIHPFDDGNGRVARALTELLLARSDRSPRRFYGMARQILAARQDYYRVLEQTQKGTPEVTTWLAWFLNTLFLSIEESRMRLQQVLHRSEYWKGIESVSLNDRQRKMLKRLLGSFKGNLTTQKWAKIAKVSPDTALRDINDLISKGILTKDKGEGRSTAYSLTYERLP